MVHWWVLVHYGQEGKEAPSMSNHKRCKLSINPILFCFDDATSMAFHIAIINAIFISEKDDDLHLGRIDHC
jgi:hypothetical protein